MSKRRLPMRTWIVTGPHGGVTLHARTRGNAVHKYHRGHTLQTDHETGGWKGVSAEVVEVVRSTCGL